MAPPKALIMDDDNEFRMLLHEFLLDIGLAVMSASSVTEALDMAQSETPDVNFTRRRAPGRQRH